jgi:hypothetical protein
MVALLIGPLWILVFYSCKYYSWTTEEFDQKFGSVLDGLKKENLSSLFYPVFFMVRRLAFVYFGVWLASNFSFQLFSAMILTLIQVGYLLVFKP